MNKVLYVKTFVFVSYRVLVLDSGEVKEYDTPAALLNEKSSIFYSMAEHAGLV